ncbi:hypothetical protein HA402_003703 [Bradysia odoriphaga]|nr:hypothetical protein HA402_003703 [Bradysia odoriphaga]
MNIDNAPNTDTIETYDVLELPSFDNLSSIDNTSPMVQGERKRRPKLPMNPITEFDRTCKLCDERTFSTLGLLYRHQRQMHPGMKWYSCDICGAEFSHKVSMCAHMKDRHSNSGKKHQCQFCARLFYSDREMKSHESVHLNARSYVCNLCGKGFNTKKCLNKHLDGKQHNNDKKPKKFDRNKRKQKSSVEKGIYRCEICKPSIVFTSREDRAHHKNLMHKVHECDICKNSFLTLESLDRHKLLHSGKPRPYICSVCNASFSQSSHLSSHFKCKHTDEKRFQCSFCDKMFVENFGLTAHINLVHSKQNRTKCNECEKDFAAPKYLQLHILDKHSNECSPYDCKICGKRNLNALSLERHRRKHHKEGFVK